MDDQMRELAASLHARLSKSEDENVELQAKCASLALDAAVLRTEADPDTVSAGVISPG